MNLLDSRKQHVLAQPKLVHGASPVPGAEELLRQLQLHQIQCELQNEALREAQAVLDSERTRYQTLFDVAPVGYLTLSASGVILQANLAAARLLGVDRTTLRQRPFSAYMSPDDSDIFYLMRQRLLETGAPETGEVMMRRQGCPPFPAQLRCASAKSVGAVPELLVTVTDMTLDKQVQAMRIKEEAAELASQAKSRFLVSASHDLRQPTHAMGLFIARLAQLPQDVPNRHLVSCLEATQRTLHGMLENLFDVSRFGTGAVQAQMRPFPINDVFDQLRDGFASEAFDNGLRLRIRPSPVWLQCDPVLLHRILFNLVSNAVCYTEQGSILVTCRPASDAAQARIDVWDSGVGIAELDHGKIFEAIYQVGNPERDRAKGLGLGLNIVAHTCQLLGIALSMRSQPGRGTRFSLLIPITQALPEWAPVVPAAAAPIEGLRDRHIMVIEDDADGREALALLLASWGCQVVTADGPQQACDLLQTMQTPDVIISDYRLRDGKNGIDAVRQVREAAKQPLPACLISEDTHSYVKKLAQDAGLVLLQKPVRPAKLRSLLGHLSQNPRP